MLKWLSNLFPLVKIKQLEEENKQLRDKLAERQENINKTNAYWKKRVNELLRKNKSSQ